MDASAIAQLVNNRDKTYGRFDTQSALSQELKAVMRRSKNWGRLSADKAEALEMIVHKIARVLNGDAEYVENFRDIAGYSELVVRQLLQTDGATDVVVRRSQREHAVWVDAKD